jgi:hypothetical protein
VLLLRGLPQFFGHPKLLSVMAGPLLEHVLDWLSARARAHASHAQHSGGGSGGSGGGSGTGGCSGGSGGGGISDVLVLSAHDVTVAAVMYALRADATRTAGYWPPYGR